MSLDTLTAVGAAITGVMMGLSPLLQARRVHLLRDSSEVSLGFLLIIAVGALVWCARGVVTDDPVLIVPNGTALVVDVATLLVVLRYRPDARSSPAQRLAPLPAEPPSEV